ncbi:hypothetical protein BKA93DRAFT_750257 [Sparassis latifolia]
MAGKARWSKPYGSIMVLYYPKWRDSKCGARAAAMKKVSEVITARANAKGWDRPKVNTQQIGNWLTNNKAALDLGIIPSMTDHKFSLADAERMAKDDDYPDSTEGEGGADPTTVDDNDVESFSVEEDAAEVQKKMMGQKWMSEDFIQTVETKTGGKVLILLTLLTEKLTQIRCTKLQSPDTGGFLKFTDSVDDWQKDLWKKWGMWAMNVMIPDELKENDTEEENEITLANMQHEINDDDNVIVPAFEETWKLTQKHHLVWAIVTHQHRKIVDSKRAKCPWKKISENVRKYIDKTCWPDSVVFAEPWNIAAGGGDAMKPRGKKQKDDTDMNIGDLADEGDQDDNDNEVKVRVNHHAKGKGKQPAMRKKHVPPHSEEEFDLDNVSSSEDDSVGVKMKAVMNKAKLTDTTNTPYDEEGWQPFSPQDLVDVPQTGEASSSGVADAPAAIAHLRKLYSRIAIHLEDIIPWPRSMVVDDDWYNHDVSRIVIPPPVFSCPDPAKNDAAKLEILDLKNMVQRLSETRMDNPGCFALQLLADDTAAISQEYVKHPLREQWMLAGDWDGGLPCIAPFYKAFLHWNSPLINNPEDGSPASATQRSEFLLSLSTFKEYRLLVKVCRLTPIIHLIRDVTVALGLDDTLVLELHQLCWLFAWQIHAYTKTAYAEGSLTADKFSAYSAMTGLMEEPVIIEHQMVESGPVRIAEAASLISQQSIKTTSAPADSQAATADSAAVQPQKDGGTAPKTRKAQAAAAGVTAVTEVTPAQAVKAKAPAWKKKGSRK